MLHVKKNRAKKKKPKKQNKKKKQNVHSFEHGINLIQLRFTCGNVTIYEPAVASDLLAKPLENRSPNKFASNIRSK
jgi:hypothetical protein